MFRSCQLFLWSTSLRKWPKKIGEEEHTHTDHWDEIGRKYCRHFSRGVYTSWKHGGWVCENERKRRRRRNVSTLCRRRVYVAEKDECGRVFLASYLVQKEGIRNRSKYDRP